MMLGVTGGYFVSPASITEVTFGTPNDLFPESALIELDGGAESVEIFNGSLGEAGCQGATAGIGCAFVAGADSTTWAITFLSPFSSFKITDTTETNFGAFYLAANRASDGFDIGELELVAVPEPTSISLVGGALLAAALFCRKRQQFPWNQR
jgi:hypothetical protein